MAGAKGSSCAIPGCDSKVMRDERGADILPCECHFKICKDCYIDAVKTGGGICPGCKEPYKNTELDEVAVDNGRPLPLPPPSGMSKMERRLSMMKSTKSALVRSQTGDFDHNRWLFETKGTYGYGNAIWPKEDGFGNEKEDDFVQPTELMNRPWRPLTRKLKILAAVLSPYRTLVATVYVGFSSSQTSKNSVGGSVDSSEDNMGFPVLVGGCVGSSEDNVGVEGAVSGSFQVGGEREERFHGDKEKREGKIKQYLAVFHCLLALEQTPLLAAKYTFSNLSRADFRSLEPSLSLSFSSADSSAPSTFLEGFESSSLFCNSAMLFHAVSATTTAYISKHHYVFSRYQYNIATELYRVLISSL
ncbi:hypothetical protein JHK82_016318 [Glycine max]|nr:hypothetical protein JHK82_016318 [Glycine max]